MSLTKLAKINDNSAWALWKIEESEQDMLIQIQSKHLEQAYFHGVKHSIKRLEWLSGRLATKYLLDTFQEKFEGIFKDDSGKPHLKGSNFHISFAHTYPYVAAIVHKNMPVGIDLEFPKEKLIAIQKKFLNEREIQCANNDLQKLCIYWCAKECLFKIHGKKKVSFKENLFIEPFNIKDLFLDGYIIKDNKKYYYKLKHLSINKYQLAYNL